MEHFNAFCKNSENSQTEAYGVDMFRTHGDGLILNGISEIYDHQ